MLSDSQRFAFFEINAAIGLADWILDIFAKLQLSTKM